MVAFVFFVMSVLANAGQTVSESLGFTPPSGWMAQPLSTLKLPDGWTVLGRYSAVNTSAGGTIELGRGPLAGLSIADYAYLEVETIKHDTPEVIFDVDHENVVCTHYAGWLLTYEHPVSGIAMSFYELLLVNNNHIYRAVYAYSSRYGSDARALASLATFCPKQRQKQKRSQMRAFSRLKT